MIMSLLTRAFSQILLDMPLDTTLNLDHIHLLPHMLHQATHQLHIHLVDTHQQVTLHLEDTHQLVILLLVLILQLAHQHPIQVTDLEWELFWLVAQLLQLQHMVLIIFHMVTPTALVMESSSMENLSTGNLESAGNTACLENTKANFSRDGSDMLTRKRSILRTNTVGFPLLCQINFLFSFVLPLEFYISSGLIDACHCSCFIWCFCVYKRELAFFVNIMVLSSSST
uniref:Uncharacterized protein n=1 Tax=Rhizophora mucronata TaxID=61149 RepID=A0A2P2IWS8_RHIMU